MILANRQIKEISSIVRERVLLGAALSKFTSFKIGGPADLITEPADVEQLRLLISYLADEKIPRMILGAGTNILFKDQGFRGVVVRTASLQGLSVIESGSGFAEMTVMAGTPLHFLINQASKQELSGLEPLWGIPGSLEEQLRQTLGPEMPALVNP